MAAVAAVGSIEPPHRKPRPVSAAAPPSLTCCPRQRGGRPLLGEAVCLSSWKAEPGAHWAMTYLCVRMRVCVCARVCVYVHVHMRAPTQVQALELGSCRLCREHLRMSRGPRGRRAPLFNITYRFAFICKRGCLKIAKGIVGMSQTFPVFSEQPISAERRPADPLVYVALTFVILMVCSHNYRRRALKNGLEWQSPSFIQPRTMCQAHSPRPSTGLSEAATTLAL